MTPISRGESTSFYCLHCKLQFGAVLDAKGKTRCPLCKNLIDEKSEGVIRLSPTIYWCRSCSLRFGVVSKDGKPVKCPVCPTN